MKFQNKILIYLFENCDAFRAFFKPYYKTRQHVKLTATRLQT